MIKTLTDVSLCYKLTHTTLPPSPVIRDLIEHCKTKEQCGYGGFPHKVLAEGPDKAKRESNLAKTGQ